MVPLRPSRRVLATVWAGVSLFALAALAWLARPALAHTGNPTITSPNAALAFESGTAWLVWEVHESIVIGALAFGAWYAWAITKWRKKAALSDQPAEPWRVQSFYGSLLLMYLSLDGPLHHLADELLFSAHMLQHMLLQLVWAPLMILGIPEWLWRALYNLPGCKRFGAWAAGPLVASIAFNGATWAWHWPDAYNLALEQHPWHVFEHLLFMTTSVMFWFVAIAPLPELKRSYPRRMVFIFVNMFGMKILGLIISMSSDVLYTFYAKQPRAWGLDAMSDQQIGGLLMWMPGGGLMWFGLGRVFWQWVNLGTPKRGTTGIEAIDRARGHKTSVQATEMLDEDQPALAAAPKQATP